MSAAGRVSRSAMLVAAAVAVGAALGIGAFTFVYAKGASYLSTDPAVCANCHIMGEHFDAWQRSSHRIAAGCADCHMPHDLFRKYVAKASNGFWHSLAFTTGEFPDPLQIKPHNRTITEDACRYCHAEMVAAIDPPGSDDPVEILSGVGGTPVANRPQIHDGTVASEDRESCIRCHTYVGHMVR
ncbi:MAG TPA: cytochrome c nitrite reductase small subunit [Gemmatimonadales bacterium]|nr:cytochrome c nitrite reductase small subunit [Gemmatimonadales bacterium]